MFKASVLTSVFLISASVFSASALQGSILNHVSVSAVSATPTMLEEAISQLAEKNKASSWKITSMRIDDNSTATAVLYQ